MTVYVDASVWLASVLPESGSEAALAVLGGEEPVAASDWVLTEIASALGIKMRRGELKRPQADQVMTRCRDMLAESADLLPIGSKEFRAATGYVERTALRAADALHFAIAARFDMAVITFDRGMADAGRALGLETRLLA